MSGWEILMIGVGLSMDAFAVAICKGLSMRKINWRHALVIALFFGGFQALMPLIGWLLGSRFEYLISPVDHWIAFVLLSVIGGKMLIDGLRDTGSDDAPDAAQEESALDLRELTVMAVATSIDALAVGIGFGVLHVDIGRAISIIGCTTFALALGGVWVGNYFGGRYQRNAQIVGGAILIGIGLKILLEHLGIFGV